MRQPLRTGPWWSPGGPGIAVLAASGPGRTGRRRGLVRLGRYRPEDRFRAGLAAAGNLAVSSPGHGHHPPGRRRGLRGVRAARLARSRSRDQPADTPVRQVVGYLLVRPRHGRASRLPPDSPCWDGTGAMADHDDHVLPAGLGPGHGDRPGPHAPRRRRRRPIGRQDHRTSRGPAHGPVRWQPRRTGPGSRRWRQAGSPSEDPEFPGEGTCHGSTYYATGTSRRPVAAGAGMAGRPQARRGRGTRIAAAATR